MRQFYKSLFLITIILLLFKIISCNNVEIKTETKFTVTYESEYAKAPESIEVKENTVLSAEYLPVLEEQGYFFEGWFDGSTKVEADKYKVTKNVILYANWSANSNIEYKIEHYQQNIENDEYTIFETESKTGTTNESTLAIAKSYEGFFAKDFEQLSIQPDGTTVVKIFYDRKFVTLTFNTDGGTEIEPLSAKYGSTIPTPSLPLKTGYTFLDWEPELPEIMPSEDMLFVANWSANTLSLIIHAPKETDIPKLESPKISDTSLIFTAPCNYITYSWYLDGIVLTYSSSKTLILDTLNLNAGSHFIMLVVSDIVGNIYSSQYEIEVLK